MSDKDLFWQLLNAPCLSSVTCLSTHQLPATPVISVTCQGNGTWDNTLSACIRNSTLYFIMLAYLKTLLLKRPVLGVGRRIWLANTHTLTAIPPLPIIKRLPQFHVRYWNGTYATDSVIRKHWPVSCLSTHQLPLTPVTSATCKSDGTWNATLSSCVRNDFHKLYIHFILKSPQNIGILKQHARKLGQRIPTASTHTKMMIHQSLITKQHQPAHVNSLYWGKGEDKIVFFQWCVSVRINSLQRL